MFSAHGGGRACARETAPPNLLSPGMFWADLRAGDAGNAEEELGVQQSTSAVFPTGRVALALRARRHTAQLDFLECFVQRNKKETC